MSTILLSVKNVANTDSIANKLLMKGDIGFWKDVKNMNNVGRTVLASPIDGVSGDKYISSYWPEYYRALINSNNNTKFMSPVYNLIHSVCNCDPVSFLPFEID